MAPLPPYKPSGQDGAADMKGIIVSQILAWGAFKQQFKKKYRNTAGTEYIDGIEVFKPIEIKGQLSSDTETKDLLKFIGFDSEDLSKLNEQIENPDYQITQASLGYRLSSDFDETDFDFAVEGLSEYIEKMDYMYVELNNSTTGKSIRQLGVGLNILTSHNANTTIRDYYFSKWSNMIFQNCPEAVEPDIRMYYNNLRITPIKNGVDVSSQFPESILNILSLIAAVEPGMVAETYVSQRNKLVRYDSTNENTFYCTETTETTAYIPNKIKKYKYSFSNFSKSTMKTRYNNYVTKRRYTNACSDSCSEEEKDRHVARQTLSNLFWAAKDNMIFKIIEQDQNNLFIMEKVPEINPLRWMNSGSESEYEPPPTKIFLRVDGIDKVEQDTFGYLMSSFMDIKYTRDSGSWLQRFVGGLIKAILSFIDAIITLFLKIPILKQTTIILISFISKIFGVEIDVGRKILVQIIFSIFMIFVIGPLTGKLSSALGIKASNLAVGLTAGTSSLLTHASQAMQIYNAAMLGKQTGERQAFAEERADKEYQLQKRKDPKLEVKKAFLGTMGTHEEHQGKDNMMYSLMFNPFDTHQQAVIPEKMDDGYLF